MNIIKTKYIISTIVIIALGTLFHFIYEFSNENPFIGIFGSVNESIWEHLKLLFWPFILVGFFEYFTNKKHLENILAAMLLSVIVGIFLILMLFYTYSGIIGKNYLVIDILVFVIAVVVCNYIYFIVLNSNKFTTIKINMVSLVLLITLMILFVYFTFDPPKIPLFKDPLTLRYGIKK